jgi:hypothetical protein
MTHRLLASVSIAVLGVGSMLVTETAFARGGGFARASGGIRAPAFHMHHARTGLQHHRRGFGSDTLPAVWGEPAWTGMQYAPPIYYLVSYSQLPDPTAYPVAEAVASPRHISARDRPAICNSWTMKVPSERGGERAITVTRC